MSSQSNHVLIVDNNWSGLEALELLKAREFDLVLVSSYLPDLYVRDFFDRFNLLPVRPCAIVMQEGKSQSDVLVKVKSMMEEAIHSDN
jgi:hypothetical protein